MRRLLSVEEVSAAVVYLSGELAGGVTGVPVIVDGGYTAQ
jgi:3-hydroxybutyrate dehydrogenase